jgi:hypothetical protein
MKTTTTRFQRCILAGFVCLGAVYSSPAAETPAAASGSDTQAPAPVISSPAPVVSTAPATAPVKLPYGVEDVLKLSRAQISEEVIMNYVQNSGTIYNLSPKEIVYLHDQGVSEKVIGTMLDQRKRVEMASQAPVAPYPAIPNSPSVPYPQQVPDASTVPAAPTDANGVPYATAPLTPPASSVYVVPYSGASYPYYGSYGYYPYPYYYGGWYGPSIGLRFGFGGGHGHFFGGRGGFARGGGHFGHR